MVEQRRVCTPDAFFSWWCWCADGTIKGTALANETGFAPIVIDAADLQDNPEIYLPKLCSKLNISWDPRMLKWEPGLKSYDGIWASHWYPSVKTSTGFIKRVKKKEFSLSALNFAALAEDSYHELLSYKI